MAYVKKADRVRAAKIAADPETTAGLTDEELGIGVEDEAEAAPDPLAALLADPRMAALLDAAVAARIAQMGAVTPAAGLDASAFADLASTLKHMVEINAIQQPGYMKPLPAEEVDRRTAGKVEMFALLKHYREIGLAPAWIVGEEGFFECNNAEEFKPGAKIRMFMPPPEDFIPDNEAAAKVMAAQMQWLGGPTPDIGETVEAAERAAIAKQGPIVTGSMQPMRARGAVELVEDAPLKAPPSRKRVMGTITPERRDVSVAERLGAPQGPTYIGADAA